MPRSYSRDDTQLRPFTLDRDCPAAAPGRVLVRAGETVVLCTASVSDAVPAWLAGSGKGWVTAEYSMLPGSTAPRKPRERQKVDGRTTEIQRLIGRSLRAVVNLEALGERLVTVDCDVLRADGGTRTASVTGAFVALVDALEPLEDAAGVARRAIVDSVAAVSVGLVDGRVLVDLDYREDFAAAVDMNVVMTGGGRFVEVQGTGEEATFTADELQQLLAAAQRATVQLTAIQRDVLGAGWPFE